MSEGNITIFYGGRNAFPAQPTPFVGLDEANLYYGEQWAKQQTMTLEGQLTGCTFDLIATAQNSFVDRFRRSFQTLEIHQVDALNSGVVFQSDLVEIDSIDFPASKWQGILPYSIKLKCFPSGYFSGAFGILDPKDTWAYQEQQNYVAQITHTVGCRGINTSAGASNAISNAINWANAKRGTSDIVPPVFIQNVTPDNFCLLTSNENIDRINGAYSIVDTYTNDLARSGYGVIRYSTTMESGNSLITVGIQGTVQGCQRDIASVRAAFANFNPTGAAVFVYTGTYGVNDLNPFPLVESITEDVYNATLSFSYQFDNSSLPPVYYDYAVSLASGNTITAGINGRVIARGGTAKSKLTRAKEYAHSLNLYELISPFYTDFFPRAAAYPLNPRPVTSGISINESEGTLTLNAEFNTYPQLSAVLDYFDYTAEITPSTEQLGFVPILDGYGKYSFVDLGYGNRGALSIQGTAVVNSHYSVNEGRAAIDSVVQSLFALYGSANNASFNRKVITDERADNRLVSFDYQWTFAASQVIADKPFLQLKTLAI